MSDGGPGRGSRHQITASAVPSASRARTLKLRGTFFHIGRPGAAQLVSPSPNGAVNRRATARGVRRLAVVVENHGENASRSALHMKRESSSARSTKEQERGPVGCPSRRYPLGAIHDGRRRLYREKGSGSSSRGILTTNPIPISAWKHHCFVDIVEERVGWREASFR